MWYYKAMQVGSIDNSYTDLFQNMADSQAKEIKKTVIMQELGLKVAMASLTADGILSSFDGYEMDSVIPENSTISFHV